MSDATVLTNVRALHIVRKGINERAKHLRAPERERRHAVNIGVRQAELGTSVSSAIRLGNDYLRGCVRPVRGGLVA